MYFFNLFISLFHDQKKQAKSRKIQQVANKAMSNQTQLNSNTNISLSVSTTSQNIHTNVCMYIHMQKYLQTLCAP